MDTNQDMNKLGTIAHQIDASIPKLSTNPEKHPCSHRFRRQFIDRKEVCSKARDMQATFKFYNQDSTIRKLVPSDESGSACCIQDML